MTLSRRAVAWLRSGAPGKAASLSGTLLKRWRVGYLCVRRLAVPGEDGQWSRALGLANEVRSSRGRLKHELAAGTVSILEVLADPPPCAETATVRQLLLVLPKFGPVKAGRLLTRCQITDGKTVADLSDRQRAALIERLSS